MSEDDEIIFGPADDIEPSKPDQQEEYEDMANNNGPFDQQTFNLACDYIRWKLKQHQRSFECEGVKSEPDKVCYAMRYLASRYESDYKEQIDEMVLELQISHHTLTKEKLTNACNSIFEDGDINWGRIVALFAFGGAVASYCVNINVSQTSLPTKVTNIKTVDYVIQVVNTISEVMMNTELSSWTEKHGGWDGLVEFYDKGKRSWFDLKYILVAAGVAVILGVAVRQILSKRQHY